MKRDKKMSALHTVLARENGKILRQEAALAATKALIVVLEREIAAEKDETQETIPSEKSKK